MTRTIRRFASLGPASARRDDRGVLVVSGVICSGQDVRRGGYIERLAATPETWGELPEHVPLNDTHMGGGVRSILGRAGGFWFAPEGLAADEIEVVDPQTAALIEAGVVAGLSIEAEILDAADLLEDGERVVLIHRARLIGLAVVARPADPGATFRSEEPAMDPEIQTTEPQPAEPGRPIIRAAVAPTGSEDPAATYALREEALFARMTGTEPSAGARQFAALGYAEHAALCLRSAGERDLGVMSREAVLHRAMAHGTSDFPQLLTGAGARSLRAAYQNAASPLRALARAVTASDFRPQTEIALGGLGTLAEVSEHGEITATSTAEESATWGLKTFGRTFALTRKAIINDDLAGFGRVTAELGRSAAETENAALAALLVSNPVMGDGAALFHANHGNLAAAGAAIGEATLSAARLAMRSQTGVTGERISVTPRHLVVGPALETTAEKFLATINPATADDVNPFAGRLQLAVEPRLAGNAWYVMASPAEASVLLLGHLASAPGPQISSRDGWETLGREFRVVLDFAVAATDWRGAYRNAGA